MQSRDVRLGSSRQNAVPSSPPEKVVTVTPIARAARLFDREGDTVRSMSVASVTIGSKADVSTIFKTEHLLMILRTLFALEKHRTDQVISRR